LLQHVAALLRAAAMPPQVERPPGDDSDRVSNSPVGRYRDRSVAKMCQHDVYSKTKYRSDNPVGIARQRGQPSVICATVEHVRVRVE
jgi:hypothetical protein